MPSTVIHEYIGYNLKLKNTYEFYLGIIAPDATKLYGFGEKIDRWTAHVRREDLNDWRISLKELYNKEKNNYNEDFLLGYIIHILTDIVYDDYLYKKVRKQIRNDYSCSKKEAHTIMRNDMDKFYFKEYEEILNILSKNNTSFDILNIDKNKLLLWKQKQIKEHTFSNDSSYITEEVLNKLLFYVKEELNSIIENN